MIFIETTLFTKLLPSYSSDDEYRELQGFLIENPTAGDIIQGTGGLRKIRWSSSGKGKRGGIRIIYYLCLGKDQIYLMTLYAKNEIIDLSSDDKKALRQILEKMLKGH
jgi:hypothetical protein